MFKKNFKMYLFKIIKVVLQLKFRTNIRKCNTYDYICMFTTNICYDNNNLQCVLNIFFCFCVTITTKENHYVTVKLQQIDMQTYFIIKANYFN